MYLGLTVDQLQLVFKYNFNETIHPDDYPDFIKAWTESFGKSVTLTAEFRVKRASDNTYRWCMMRSVPGICPPQYTFFFFFIALHLKLTGDVIKLDNDIFKIL